MATTQKEERTLEECANTIIDYLLWDDENWEHLVETSEAAGECDGDAFMKEWEDRANPSSPFHNHIAVTTLLLREKLFGEKVEEFIYQYANEYEYTFAADEDEE